MNDFTSHLLVLVKSRNNEVGPIPLGNYFSMSVTSIFIECCLFLRFIPIFLYLLSFVFRILKYLAFQLCVCIPLKHVYMYILDLLSERQLLSNPNRKDIIFFHLSFKSSQKQYIFTVIFFPSALCLVVLQMNC